MGGEPFRALTVRLVLYNTGNLHQDKTAIYFGGN